MEDVRARSQLRERGTLTPANEFIVTGRGAVVSVADIQ